jgi:hypothetical protein
MRWREKRRINGFEEKKEGEGKKDVDKKGGGGNNSRVEKRGKRNRKMKMKKV